MRITISFLLLMTPNIHAGGGWTLPARSYYVKAGWTYLHTDEFHTRTGKTLKTADFETWTFLIYGEYGLTSRWTLICSAPVIKQLAFETTKAAYGFGDLEVDVKYGLLQGAFPTALRVGVGIPTGDHRLKATLKDGSGAFVILPTGDNEWNIKTQVDLSHSLTELPMFFSVTGGFNYRTQGFTHEYLYGAEMGFNPARSMWLFARLNGIGPIGKTDPDLTGGSAVRFGLGEGVQYNSYGLGFSYGFTSRFSLTGDIQSAFAPVKNIYSGIHYMIGVAIQS